jgi:hypothetical protein
LRRLLTAGTLADVDPQGGCRDGAHLV